MQENSAIYDQLAEYYDIVRFGFAFRKEKFIEHAIGVKIIRKGNFDYPYLNVCFLNDIIMQSMQILREGYIPRIELNRDRRNEGWIDWEDYFFQPFYEYEEYIKTLPVVEQLEPVYPKWAGLRYEACFQEHERMLATKLYQELVVINDSCFSYIAQEYQELIRGKRVLGILCRGTDMTDTKMKDHPIQPDLDLMLKDAKEMKERLDCPYIYLATEDEVIAERFMQAFPEFILTNKRHYMGEEYRKAAQERKRVVLNDIYRQHASENFVRGLEYLSSIILLSQCNALLAGNCGGSEAALYYNEFQYEEWKIYNLGLYP